MAQALLAGADVLKCVYTCFVLVLEVCVGCLYTHFSLNNPTKLPEAREPEVTEATVRSCEKDIGRHTVLELLLR